MESLSSTALTLPPWGLLFAVSIASLSGASLASFVNVLIYRVPLDMPVDRPPSACPRCAHQIRWFENIPVLSYLALLGRCHACHQPISPRYLLIELMGGLWGLVLGARWVWPTLSQPALWAHDVSALYPLIGAWLFELVFVSALIAVAFIDLEHTFIPDEITLPATLFGVWGTFTLATWLPHYEPLSSLFGACLGWGLIVSIRSLAYLYYQREAMGLGDAKLLMMIGAFLGARSLPLILLGASVQGVIAALIALTYSRLTGRQNELTMTTSELDERFGEVNTGGGDELAIPFGPFLALSALELLVLDQVAYEWVGYV